MCKIIIIGNTASSLINFRKHFIIYLIQQKYEVYCFAIDYTAETKKQIYELEAKPVDYELSRGGLNPIHDIIRTQKLAKKIKKINPDIVFSSFAKPVIFGTLAAKKAGVKKVIAMLEGLGYFFTEQPTGTSLKTKLIKQIQVILYKFTLPKADVVIFLNEDDPNDLLTKYSINVKQKEILGGIGLNLTEFPYSLPSISSISFIFVGRLLKEKGIFDYLKAAKIIKSLYPKTTFYVIGGLDTENPGGLKEDELEYYIKEDIIEYPGLVRNVKDWIAKSSVFVLPSYREGLPRSTQEAMAMGRAIITTDVPGCRETVNDGINGFIIQKWSIEDLVQKMKFFIENPEKIIEMGKQSYELAKERFDGQKVNKSLLQIIES